MEVKLFTNFLQELQDGGINHELSDQLNELVRAIDSTGKAGSLTLRVKISPNKRTGMVFVDTEIKLNNPIHDRPSSMFYIDPHDSNLVRNNPKQMNFDDLQVKKIFEKS